MRRKSFQDMGCPIARSLEQVGEWWSILIIRDALAGLSKFDEFQKNLEIAPNMLTRRLNSLIEAGLLERRQYNDHPPRYEYIPTKSAESFRIVLLSLLTWGNQHCLSADASVQIANVKTGKIAEPILVDRETSKPILSDEFEIISGPAADAAVRDRIDWIRHNRNKKRNATRSLSATDETTKQKSRKKRTSARR
ncbi:helix-turn-helix transcriptional regulator [Blastopirellula sp. J2-11]|uniref:winged helix-turn-helix transcriptional regulator n=1 Tax=Blastopirellula sp. J2-11 TaxID=2943192 RepID=UPI0021C8F9B5|nr:helix-turn-helix domain-containing protein [Blastopirellula sp. J2-11]UUO06173.1 helix-turn-helix transcriptional regulator [Blastopirellula sp. J2-11]